MYAVTGVTGQVGGAVARNLLVQGKQVRAVVRDARRAAIWVEKGCEIATADISNAYADRLTEAFRGTEGVFILLPPVFDPAPGYPESQGAIQAIRKALITTRPDKVVCLSTIGGQLEQTNLLEQLHILETVLQGIDVPVTFLRPSWFMENCSWDLGPALETGRIPSFLQPLNKQFPMVATADVGKVAADLLLLPAASRVVELEGPTRISPHEIGHAFSQLLGKNVVMDVVPRESWEALFRSQGMKNPEPRMQMLDGFNEGWIEFEGGEVNSLKGKTTIDTVLQELLERVK